MCKVFGNVQSNYANFINSESLTLDASKNIYKDGETIEAYCRSEGYPPMKMILMVVTEYDTVVESLQFDENIVNITFQAEWKNNWIKLKYSFTIAQELRLLSTLFYNVITFLFSKVFRY